MVAFVQSNQIVGVNGQSFLYPNEPNGVAKQLPCDNVEIINSFWKIPVKVGNILQGYTRLLAVETSTKPQPDALKILLIKDKQDNTEYEIAIADDDNVSTTTPICQYAFLCNGSGGTLPVMPTVTIPMPILQNGPASTDPTSGDTTFIYPFPANPNALEYTIGAAWFNGAAGTPPFSPSGITTPAGFVTWANSNWSAYGTWTNPTGDIIQLASTTGSGVYVTESGIDISLTAAPYCFDFTAYSTPAAINQVKFGSGPLIPFPAFMLTDANQAQVINALQKIDQRATFAISTHKLQMTTVQDTPALYNNGVSVEASTAGAC